MQVRSMPVTIDLSANIECLFDRHPQLLPRCAAMGTGSFDFPKVDLGLPAFGNIPEPFSGSFYQARETA